METCDTGCFYQVEMMNWEHVLGYLLGICLGPQLC